MRRPAAPRSRGQALVEFALVAPIFLFVMLALLEFGRAVFYTQILDSAARDGARYAVVNGAKSFCPSGPMPSSFTGIPCDPSGNNVLDVVRDRAIGVADKATSLQPAVKWCDASDYQNGASNCNDYPTASNPSLGCSSWTDLGDGDNSRGQIVTVCVDYTYQSLLSTLLPIPDFTVTGRATLVVNH